METSLILKEREFKLVIYKNIEKQLEDSEFRAEYETTRTEFEVVRALIEIRVSINMTQIYYYLTAGSHNDSMSFS